MGIPPYKTADRKTLLAMFYDGATLSGVARHFDCSKERIRQILKSEKADLSKGGAMLRRRRRAAALAKAKGLAERAKLDQRSKELQCDRRWLKRFMHEHSDHTQIFAAYARSTAYFKRKYGVTTFISFTDWWTIWEDSCLWPKRGAGRGHSQLRLVVPRDQARPRTPQVKHYQVVVV